MKNKDFVAFGAALGAAFFWSFSFIWFKIAYLAYNPVTVVIFRLAISAVLITSIGLFLKRLQKPSRKDLWLFILMAFFQPFVYFLGESYGLKYVSSTVAAVIVATIPLFTPIAAWYFYREKVKWINVAGLTISFLGVGLVVLNSSFKFQASPLGVGLEFIAVFSAIGYAIVLKNLASRYNTLTIIAYQNIIGIFMFLPVWLAVDFKEFIVTPFHPQAFRAIILLAVFSSTLAFVFFTQSVRQLGVNRSNTFINLIPVFVAVFSFIILNETLGLQKIVGIVVVVAGLFLAQAKRRRKKSKAIEVYNA
ncbi:MAG: DMT family transporter [Prolixibacteraceae bacterium]|jgi:drug/metabolite transporter (DMT)-like permease|nr:DMT family transporter [Prolixibacteraceae bacterium]MBT6005053.1 DMT family transporter [Prolixibacteraceae bacterium]MBT6764193.1 DMT family transporter [Prolixibacteraceae bacterium]MBT6999138.1 DMT family transporter [Prolixibacteraceae bacterium]MBT7396092.1 DMT family transporter [Prolixibacteraceae bacterium]